MQVTTTKAFDKQFRKQPKHVREAFKERVDLLIRDEKDPRLNIHKLSGTLKNLHSFNVTGDIRVLFDDRYSGMCILVAIGSHSELYS